MFAVKIVTGGSFPDATEYDEENVVRLADPDDAVREARDVARSVRDAVDVIDESNEKRVARVFADGGVNYS